ncbi:hypothetical protein [Vibrio phage JSF7]|uniref:TMhelix containing protein n=1 Tax=Vibrio phage JSF7 TaxID=1292086 RepID=A0A240EWV0_9CAUD|nr:hypothetical protein HOQ92_gp17 [Vibrio phage JSF7]APD18141.1 hypothetical protein [Vibrio phage JSF7]
MPIKTILAACAVGAIVWASVLNYAVPAFNAEMEAYKQENACIARYIAQGVERKDIKRTNGGCAVVKYSN